jgi:hypothetical protein
MITRRHTRIMEKDLCPGKRENATWKAVKMSGPGEVACAEFVVLWDATSTPMS